MEQLELFKGLQPIKLLQSWQEKQRHALLHDTANRAKPSREEIADRAACERIQATAFSGGRDDSSGQISRQLVRKC